MFELKCSRPVAAPPARVFEILADLRGGAKRITAITKLEVLTPGPIGKGTRFRETRVMFGREATEEMEITHFDPPRSYTTEARSHGCHYVCTLRCEPRGSGTELEMGFAAKPMTFGARIMGLLMKPFAKKLMSACSKDLDDIAAAAENRTRAG